MADLTEREEQLLRQLLHQAEVTREQLADLRETIVKRHQMRGIPLSGAVTVLNSDVLKLAVLAARLDEQHER